MPQTSEVVQRVESAIRACAPAASRTGPTVWHVSPGDPARAGCHVFRLDGDWLILEAPLAPPGTGRSLWRDLVENANVSGPTKLALADDERGRIAQAEIPLDDEVDLAVRIDQARAGLRQLDTASGAVHPDIGSQTAARAGAPGDAAPPFDLPQLLTAAGWTFVERGERGFSVDLRVPGQFRQAIVGLDRAGGLRVGIDLIAPRRLSPASREALGALLLATSRVCRMVRGAAREDGPLDSVAFEVSVAAPPTAVELDHALSALSIACRESAREAAILEDEYVAAMYLDIFQGRNRDE